MASGVITEFATGYPGYNSLVPKSAGSVGAVLKDNGYNTSWFGKMHNVPDWMSSQAGPFDLWPTGLGFATTFAGRPRNFELERGRAAEAAPDVAVQIYNRAIHNQMLARIRQGQTIPQVIAWAQDELEGFAR